MFLSLGGLGLVVHKNFCMEWVKVTLSNSVQQIYCDCYLSKAIMLNNLVLLF